MTEYIIHADDFGKDDEVNACIVECFCRGWVSETSLMVNMPACERAVELAHKNGFSHLVGLHLNLSEGKPLTEEVLKCPRICSPDGCFNQAFHKTLKGRFFLTVQESHAIMHEIEAQIKKFVSYGDLMMKLDSHHHVHTDWSVYRLLKSIARRSGFTAIRLSADLHRVSLAKELYKRFFNSQLRRIFKTTHHFDGVNAGVLVGPGGTVEVMVHPLMQDGVMCDTRTPYAEMIERIAKVPMSKIRRK